MRRNGFTMVELIFVIIIIGILSVAAIPKFGDIKDRAKINSEYSAMSGLDGAIRSAIEFQAEDENNIGVLWHEQDSTLASSATKYKEINDAKKVLSKVAKKSDALKIVAFYDLNDTGEGNGDAMKYDILLLEGSASSHISGAVKKKDVPGRPDKNDFWVFNTSPLDVNITGDTGTFDPTIIESGELKLIDSNKTITYSNVKIANEKITTATAVTPVN